MSQTNGPPLHLTSPRVSQRYAREQGAPQKRVEARKESTELNGEGSAKQAGAALVDTETISAPKLCRRRFPSKAIKAKRLNK